MIISDCTIRFSFKFSLYVYSEKLLGMTAIFLLQTVLLHVVPHRKKNTELALLSIEHKRRRESKKKEEEERIYISPIGCASVWIYQDVAKANYHSHCQKKLHHEHRAYGIFDSESICSANHRNMKNLQKWFLFHCVVFLNCLSTFFIQSRRDYLFENCCKCVQMRQITAKRYMRISVAIRACCEKGEATWLQTVANVQMVISPQPSNIIESNNTKLQTSRSLTSILGHSYFHPNWIQMNLTTSKQHSSWHFMLYYCENLLENLFLLMKG